MKDCQRELPLTKVGTKLVALHGPEDDTWYECGAKVDAETCSW